MLQVARNVTDGIGGFLLGKCYLILDRDTKYSQGFREFLEREGIKVIRLPPRSPNLNAYAERFVRSIKDELIYRMIFFGAASLRRAFKEYMAHYHIERNHQGLSNRLLRPSSGVSRSDGVVNRRKRLGGMLSYYQLVGLVRADGLLIQALDVRRQQAVQAKLAALLLRERRAFVQPWAFEEIHPARAFLQT